MPGLIFDQEQGTCREVAIGPELFPLNQKAVGRAAYQSAALDQQRPEKGIQPLRALSLAHVGAEALDKAGLVSRGHHQTLTLLEEASGPHNTEISCERSIRHRRSSASSHCSPAPTSLTSSARARPLLGSFRTAAPNASVSGTSVARQ